MNFNKTLLFFLLLISSISANAEYFHVLGVQSVATVKSGSVYSSASGYGDYSGVSPFLGATFIGDLDSFGSQSCLNGSEVLAGYESVNPVISLDTNYNYQELKKISHIRLMAGIPIGRLESLLHLSLAILWKNLIDQQL